MFRTLAASRHLNIVDSARLFASENLAAADAAIGCWNNKYHWNTWRPITAIREAASDGNRGHHARPDMDTAVRSLHAGGHAPRRSSPRRSPSTPPATTARPARSSRRCRTSSTPTRSPSARPATSPGTTRTFHRFSDALQENINARVWAGIHFRTADIQGAKLGEKVARYLHKHYLQPAH